MKDNYRNKWEQSFTNRDNYIFYPDEDVIRFVSKYIRKRTGLFDFDNKINNIDKIKLLDIGCGIGPNLFFCLDMGIDTFGVDLSQTAINYLYEIAKNKKINLKKDKVIQSDISNLPFENNFFDFSIARSVLDSVDTNTAKKSFNEISRVLKPKSYFYCDVWSDEDNLHEENFKGEEIVTTKHEEGTVQLYYNEEKIRSMTKNLFEIKECKLIKYTDLTTGKYKSRFQLVFRNN